MPQGQRTSHVSPGVGALRGAHPRLLGITLAVVCASAIGLSASSTSEAMLHGVGSSTSSTAPALGIPPRVFLISGSVGRLYPGATARLILTVLNPQHFAIDVTSIATAVDSPGPGCTASNLTVAPFSGHLTVAPMGFAHVAVTIGLSHSAPDACQAAIFPLHYTGSAEKA